MSREDYPVAYRLLCLKDGIVLKFRFKGCPEGELVMTDDEAATLGAELLAARHQRMRASGTIGAAPEPAEPKRPCEGFRWIGQSFAHCDRCGLPFWEHTHEERLKHDTGLRLSGNPGELFDLVLITPESAAACKAKWGPK